MAYIEWQERMETGIPLVDADHKTLVSLINQVHACIGGLDEYGALGSILKVLADYTDYHFKREEALMAEAGYPGLDVHKALHSRLTEQVREVLRRFEAAPGSVRAQDIQKFLEDWLVDHILRHDMPYTRFALGNQAAYDAAEAVNIADLRGSSKSGQIDWSTFRVLVVDDNAHFRILMETVLSGVGVGIVKTEDNALKGLDLLGRQPFDLVITDWWMDGVNGVEFVDRVRSSLDPIMANVGIIMVTARCTDDVRAQARAAGVDDFLEKPVSARDLLQSVQRAMAARRG
ncbi:MAG TPA: bacteriohemerythrin [Candidatus Sulfotelmatobacter sp.]|jgi:hemerythrin-like metal-binding protein|nr:bacteriohemerythrin [Candidatus Sulfotelmatobacter sp.]